MAEPKNPALPKLRDWPMFRHPSGKRSHRSPVLDGRAAPHISELIMALVPGTAPDKLTWLQQLKAAGKLDGDDPDEIAEAEAMLERFAEPKARSERRHLDELLDQGLKDTFPASDPVSIGHFTSTEAPSRPIDSSVVDVSGTRKTKGRAAQRPRVKRHG